MRDKSILFSRCFSCREGKEYIFFSNNDGKSWGVPVKPMTEGLALYQPGGRKGKFVKRFLPFIYRLPCVGLALHLDCCDLKLAGELHDLIVRIFQIEDYYCSFFSGTPGVHQKVTIQIFSEGRILGYLKCSSSDEVASLFLHEKKILARLNETSLKGQIPECLYCGTLDDGVHVFVQSTIKTRKSSVLHKWTDAHEWFLRDMTDATSSDFSFEATDLYESIRVLKGYLSFFTEEEQQILKNAIERVENQWGGRTVSFSAYHGDFTPWNMFAEKGRLFVFDFEYAGQSYPPMLDQFHFLVQTGIFEKKRDVDEIFCDYLKLRQEREGCSSAMDMDFLCYLLDIISRFVRRENGSFEGDVRRCMNIWLTLVAKL